MADKGGGLVVESVGKLETRSYRAADMIGTGIRLCVHIMGIGHCARLITTTFFIGL